MVAPSILPIVLDACFVVVAALYDTQVVEPLPMTYLSEITFPFDFCLKLAVSSTLSLFHVVLWIIGAWQGTIWRAHGQLAMLETLAWSVASLLLWNEHRRSLTPSRVLRGFWLAQWMLASYTLIADQTIAEIDIAARTTWQVLLASVLYVLIAMLGVSCFFQPTPVTADLIVLPAVNTPSYYCRSTRSLRQAARFSAGYGSYGGYGSFGSHEFLGKDLLAPPEMAMLVPDDPNGGHDQGGILTTTLSGSPAQIAPRSRVRVMSTSMRSSAIARASGAAAPPPIRIAIPSSTTSMWGKQHFVSYKIVVQTDDDRWSVRRQYSDFALLHEELPREVAACCILPPEERPTRRFFSWKKQHRPMQSKLERYLQQVLHQRTFEPYSSQALCDFLDMEYVDEGMLRSYTSISEPQSWDQEPIQVP